MQKLLTPEEFTARAVGLPWVRWRSDWAAVDCFGLIVLYFREVLGVELGDVPQTDIATGFEAARGWIECGPECGPEAGATCWMAFMEGAPAHCGVLISPTQVLHSENSPEGCGSVRVTRLRVMQRLWPDLRFYRYDPC